MIAVWKLHLKVCWGFFKNHIFYTFKTVIIYISRKPEVPNQYFVVILCGIMTWSCSETLILTYCLLFIPQEQHIYILYGDAILYNADMKGAEKSVGLFQLFGYVPCAHLFYRCWCVF